MLELKGPYQDHQYSIEYRVSKIETLVLFETQVKPGFHPPAKEVVWARFAKHLFNKIQKVRKELDDLPAEDTDCKHCGNPREDL
jgi:hypothetical protein